MPAESTVGVRLLLIGKDAMLAGYKEITAAQAAYNREVANSVRINAQSAAASDSAMTRLGRFSGYLNAYDASLAKSAARQDALTRVGRTAFLGLAAATAVWGYESIKWASSYQRQLLMLHTQAGLTTSAMYAVGRAAMANAANFGVSPQQYAQAAYHPASVGFRGQEITAITEAGLKEAKISGADAETTVNSLTSVMRAYNMSAQDATRTQALLNAAVGQGNMRYSEFNAALHSGIAGTAHLYGIKLPSWLAALSYMTDQGVPAAQAGTRLRMGLSLLGAPSNESTKFLNTLLGNQQSSATQSAVQGQLQAMGLTTTALTSAMQSGGIYGALDVLRQAFQRNQISRPEQTAFIGRAFGGGRVGSSIMQLMNNPQLLRLKEQRIEAAADPAKFQADFQASMNTLSGSMSRFSAEIQTLGTIMGKYLIGPLTTAVHLITDFLQFMQRHMAVAAVFGTMITAVLAPAIGVYLWRSLTRVRGALTTVIGGYTDLIRMKNPFVRAQEESAKAMWDEYGAAKALTVQEQELALAQQRVMQEAKYGGGPVTYDPAMAGGAGGWRTPSSYVLRSRSGDPLATPMGPNWRFANPSAEERWAAQFGGPGGVARAMEEAGGARLGLAGFARLAGGAGLRMLGGVGTALLLQNLISGNQGSVADRRQGGLNQARSILGTAAFGAMTGATIGSFIPGVGTVIGGVAGGAAGALYGGRKVIGHDISYVGHSIAHAGEDIWHGLFGGGGSPPQTAVVASRPHLVAHVYLDGKELKQSIVKQVRSDVARQ